MDPSRKAAVFFVLLLAFPAILRSQFRLSDQESEVYYDYAVVAGAAIQVEKDAQVSGGLHGNGTVAVKKGALVTGDVSAVGEVSLQGTVTGQVTPGAAPVVLPALEIEAFRGLADRVFEGDTNFDEDVVVDDVIFVDGTVQFRGDVNGVGTIVATGDVRLDTVGGRTELVLDTEPRLSFVAGGDFRLGKDRPMRGVVRAGHDAQLEAGTSFEGVIVADNLVLVKKESSVTFVDFDQGAPEIVLVRPEDGSVLNVSPSEIVAEWSDDFSGVDVGTGLILLDGIDDTVEAMVSDTGLTLELAEALGGGTHTVELVVSDHSGNERRETFEFEIRSGPVDDVPPNVTLAAPTAIVFNELTPTIEVFYSDDESGVDTLSLSVVLDGVDLAATCTVSPTGARCEPPRLSVGEHLLRVTVRDQAGNPATAELSFTIELARVEQTVAFPFAADTLLSEATPDRNFGDVPSFDLSAGERGRLAFGLDLETVRQVLGNADVLEARVTLVGMVDERVQPSELPLVLYRLEQAWSEEGATWTCPDDSMPDNGLPDCPAPWDGGVHGAEPVSSALVAGEALMAFFDFTEELRSALGAAAGHGWLIEAKPEPTPYTITFGTREASRLVDRPKLLVRIETLPDIDTLDTTAPRLSFLEPSSSVHFNDLSQIVFDHFDAGSGVDTGSVRARFDGLELVCNVGTFGTACPLTEPSPGSHFVEIEVADLAGNLATRTLDFKLSVDLKGPVVEIAEPLPGQIVVGTSPVRVAGTAFDPQGVDDIRIGEARAAIVEGSFELFVDVESADGASELTLVADDFLENRTEVVVSFTLDSTAPTLVLWSPAPDAEVNGARVLVQGLASDLHGPPIVTVGGFPVELGPEGEFSGEVTLADGLNTIRVEAVDGVGNRTAAERTVKRFVVPGVRILTPASFTIETATQAVVTGEISDDVVAVAVNDVPAALGAGSFSATVALSEGTNAVTAVARTADGRASSDTISVIRDTTPPRLIVQSPADGEILSEPAVSVAGLVLDPVAAEPGMPGVQVTVAGRDAVVSQGTFLASAVPLAAGANSLLVSATDAQGNRTERTLSVTYQPATGARLVIVSGDSQGAAAATPLDKPLVVRAVDLAGLPVPGIPVIWSVEAGDGTFPGGHRRQLVETDASGMASIVFELGRRAGVGNHRVRVEAPGYGSVGFRAGADAGAVSDLLSDTGDQQVGAVGQRLPKPLVAGAVDAHDNLLPGAEVTFVVALGGGHLDDGSSEITVLTDDSGRARAHLTLGTEPGVANQVVWATLGGDTDGPLATFTASARTVGDPAATVIAGQILDNSDLPVPGVVVRPEGTDLEAVSDAQGLFELTGVPVGTFLLHVEGSTATRPGTWPDLEFEVSTVAGNVNTLGRPIYLVRLDTGSGLFVSETDGGTLTLPDVPGFALEVAPGSVTFPGGSRSGVVSVTSVHYDKVPMAPEMSQQPRLVVTIQPSGAAFDPPARLTLPNMEGLPPGTIADLFSFDHDVGRFVTIGPGMVSEDGLQIRSQPGVGVVKAGWHCCQHTAGSGTPHQCGYCKECVDDKCENASGPLPKAKDLLKNDDFPECHSPVCFGGLVVPMPDDGLTPEQEPGNCRKEVCQSDGKVGRLADLADTPPKPSDHEGEWEGSCCDKPDAAAPEAYNNKEKCCMSGGTVERKSIEELGLKLDDCPERTALICPSETACPDPSTDRQCLGNCSGPGWLADDINVPHYEPTASFGPDPGTPCYNHDVCYRTCHQEKGSARDDCDDAFCDELRNRCRHLPFEVRWRCFDNANAYCWAVQLGGGWPFRNNQREKCQCCPDGKECNP